ELWFKPRDQLHFQLHFGDESSPWVGPNMKIQGIFRTGNRYELFYQRFHHDNNDSYLIVTVRPGQADEIEPGTYALGMHNDDGFSPSSAIDAWVDWTRDLTIAFRNKIENATTLTVPGTAHSVICAGAVHTGP